jgi:GDP-L-fucose synthase
MVFDLKNKRVFLTGGSSMIGRAVIRKLRTKGCASIYYPPHSQCDVLQYEHIARELRKHNSDVVVHCAGYNGNIAFNKDFPAEIFSKTSWMGLNVLSACLDCKVQKVVSLISSCAYPDGYSLLEEKDFWNGLPHPSVECHGLAKRFLHAYSRQLHSQFGLSPICVILNNSYGPYDSFDPLKTKVAGGLIQKFAEAKRYYYPEVVCWGTGAPRRELLYCDDAAEGIVRAIEMYDNVTLPINITSGEDITIKELAQQIKWATDYRGEVRWDTSKPDGQMVKRLSDKRMKEYLGDIKFTPLADGLYQTVRWYEKEYYS